MLYFKIKDGGYEVFFMHGKNTLGFIKEKEELFSLLQSLVREGRMNAKESDSYVSGFEKSRSFFKKNLEFGLKSEGFMMYPELNSEDILRELEELTEESFKTMDEAMRKSWVASRHTILGNHVVSEPLLVSGSI